MLPPATKGITYAFKTTFFVIRSNSYIKAALRIRFLFSLVLITLFHFSAGYLKSHSSTLFT